MLIERFHSLRLPSVALMLSCMALFSGLAQANSNGNDPLRLEFASYQFAVFLPQAPTQGTANQAQALADQYLQAFTHLPEVPEVIDRALFVQKYSVNVAEDYPPPSVDYLGYFGRGLSAGQMQAVQSAQAVHVFNFITSGAAPLSYYQAAVQFVGAIAKQYGGYVWDEDTRELYTAQAWDARRVATWTNGAPLASAQITIHAYPEGEGARAVTLGMHKFGLPDLVIPQIARSDSSSGGSLINLVAQLLVEGRRPVDRVLAVDINQVQHEGARRVQETGLKSNANKIAKVYLGDAEPAEGDNPNKQLKLEGRKYPGRTEFERLTGLLTKLYGSEDEVFDADHSNARLQAASAAAKAQLPRLSMRLNQGMKANEVILVKAPFATDQGSNEWMWVEVNSWSGQDIGGILQSDPRYVSGLRAGAKVQVKQDDVFDYIHYLPDGRVEGNETGKIILEAQGR